MSRCSLSLAALVTAATVSFAQPKAKPGLKAQLEKAVERSLGGTPNTAYVVVLVTETPEKASLKQAGGTLLDVFLLPVHLATLATGQSSFPTFGGGANAPSSFEAEVAVFADRQSAAAAIAGFGLTPEDGKLRTWQLLKRSPELARAIQYGDQNQAKFDKMAKAGAKLVVTRRENPPAKK